MRVLPGTKYQGNRVLAVPSEMILSASQIAQEFRGYVESALQTLEQKGYLHLQPHFHLFLKILMEYEKGESSAYYPWLNSLPRRWNTAVSFDYFCMSTLPPYIKKVCQKKRDELSAFQESLKYFDYILPETKSDDELVKFAYNVVMTRILPSQEDHNIVPAADYFNHGNEANIVICYNNNNNNEQTTANCEVYASRDIAPGEALTLTYDMPTNPSHLLATYGFLNEAPATYCKLLFTNPSEKLKQIGYDPSQLVFSTQDGSISSPIWDVILYSKLERAPGMAEAKNAFYEAHMSGDEATKFAIHSHFQEATCTVLLEHVETILKEVSQLTCMMEQFRDEDRHPRLPLLMEHHAMVTSTFSKVRDNLRSMY
ncbi:unnamed protein product [Cylindrotheca closterium]|uniref:SET domain-containing protein n=1 Tax=Cylindrotheca closterium TaxID=2856 RepID=A0AAD2CPP8_9STRA|nr:unnamed protein product [Cylindrotheca closterium]